MILTALKEVYHLVKFGQAIKANNLGKAAEHHGKYKEASKLGEENIDKVLVDARVEVKRQKALSDDMLKTIGE